MNRKQLIQKPKFYWKENKCVCHCHFPKEKKKEKIDYCFLCHKEHGNDCPDKEERFYSQPCGRCKSPLEMDGHNCAEKVLPVKHKKGCRVAIFGEECECGNENTPPLPETWEERLLNKSDAEIMEWHYEVCEINFGAEGYIQDSTDLREILMKTIHSARMEERKKVLKDIMIIMEKEVENRQMWSSKERIKKYAQENGITNIKREDL